MATGREEFRRQLQRIAANKPRLRTHIAPAEALAWSRAQEADAEPSAALERLDPEAVLLSVAAAAGDSAAIVDFEAKYFGAARAALRSMRISSEMQSDALSQTLEALFVTPAKGVDGPRILELVGKGDLCALVKVVALRRAMNLQRKDRGQMVDTPDALAQAIADQTSPEWSALAAEHRGLVKEAFAMAVADLDPQARTLLRLSVLHGLSIDELGAMHNTHRSTAARRLARIRDTLRSEVRAHLRDKLGSSPRELESLLRAAHSGLEISFERLLASDAP